jgi:hypothetical protein
MNADMKNGDLRLTIPENKKINEKEFKSDAPRNSTVHACKL